MGNSAFKNLKEFFYSVDSKTEIIATLDVRDDSNDSFDTLKMFILNCCFHQKAVG